MKEKTNPQNKPKKYLGLRITIFIFSAILFLFAGLVAIRNTKFSQITQADSLTHLDEVKLRTYLNEKYYTQRQILHNLPYDYKKPDIDTLAKSAILIDVNTGDILFEKNADEVIPPASMTKLFAMYVVDEEVSSGRLSYDQIIPIPEEALACNMPPHSSLMFLGEGQKVTLEELLLGLSICSGNDAAYALAYTICGNMEDFVARMNQVAIDMGLENTYFVESSGYSELNTTTAREMAKFCRVYLSQHPESLKKFHSVPSFTYPKKQNMADGDVYGAQDFSQGLPRHITMGITQSNTNPLLGILKGCDGLKTGYIDESGYNLSLTAQRNGTRFLSVTMGGPGRSTAEGQKGRIRDGTELMNYGFEHFTDFPHVNAVTEYLVKSYGTKEMAIKAVPAFNIEGICVPSSDLGDNFSLITVGIEIDSKISGSVTQGQMLGQIKYYYKDQLIQSVPMVADRSTTKANFIVSFADKLCYTLNRGK